MALPPIVQGLFTQNAKPVPEETEIVVAVFETR